MEEIEEIERRGLLRVIFLQNIKPSSFGGTKKLYWRTVLGCQGLYEFFKFNLCCYNIS